MSRVYNLKSSSKYAKNFSPGFVADSSKEEIRRK